MLVGAVVVHNPNFLCARARADLGDLRGSDAGEPAGKAADDCVSELVVELADLRVGRRAASDEVGVNLRRGPVGSAKLGRNRGDLCGIEAGTDEVDYTAELQVVANDLGEKLGVRFGVISAGSEIRDRHAGLVDAQASAGGKPG